MDGGNGAGRTLAEMGARLAGMRFSYRVEQRPSRQYWESRAKDYEEYRSAAGEYYMQAYYMMRGVDTREAELFLVQAAKLRQTGSKLAGLMAEAAQNPSIMDAKDPQQSKWSKGVRDGITQYSEMCLGLEKALSASFRGFCEANQID